MENINNAQLSSSTVYNIAQRMDARLQAGGFRNGVVARLQVFTLPPAGLWDSGKNIVCGGGNIVASVLRLPVAAVRGTARSCFSQAKRGAVQVVVGLANVIKTAALTVTVPFSLLAPRLAIKIASIGYNRPVELPVTPPITITTPPAPAPTDSDTPANTDPTPTEGEKKPEQEDAAKPSEDKVKEEVKKSGFLKNLTTTQKVIGTLGGVGAVATTVGGLLYTGVIDPTPLVTFGANLMFACDRSQLCFDLFGSIIG